VIREEKNTQSVWMLHGSKISFNIMKITSSVEM